MTSHFKGRLAHLLGAVIRRSYRMLLLARLDRVDWRERVARGSK